MLQAEETEAYNFNKKETLAQMFSSDVLIQKQSPIGVL